MTRHKFFKRLLPIVLSAMLLFSVLPVSASANDESTNEVASKIVREVVELREESVKHFLCEDGSYIAVSYAEPVHYEKNGEWLEIDNTLVLSNKNTYVPKSNDLAVSIPQSFSGGGQITATNDGHTISFGVASGNENVALSKTAAVKAVEALPSSIAADVSVETLANAELSATATVGKVDTVAQIEAYNSEKTTVDNQAGALVYDKIFPNADLEYIVTGNSIKENVVVYQPQTEYVYTFDMDFDGLTPVAQEDGSITLVDSAKQNKVVFVIAAPFMYDASGVESYSVTMSLAPNGEKYLLTITADEEWINSSEREFPVVIDPPIYFNFDDVFVINGLYDDSPRLNNELRVGTNLANITRTYIEISEPEEIPEGSFISSARLVLKKRNFFQALSQDDINIEVYDCRDVASWSADSITWNNQPFGNTEDSYKSYNLQPISFILAERSRETYSFNITSAMEKWLETGVNNGLMLASSDESSKTQVDFYSTRALTESNHPYIYVYYTPPNISRTVWNPDESASTSPEITVNCSLPWTAKPTVSWLTVNYVTGKSAFTISATANTNASQRTGYVVVMMGNVEIGTVTVNQGGTAPYLNIDKSNLTFDYRDSTTRPVEIEISTNAEWEFEVDDSAKSWINVEQSVEDNSLTITVAENSIVSEDDATDKLFDCPIRDGTVTITTKDTTQEAPPPQTITVIQLDKVTSCFNTINADGTLSGLDNADYHHLLATWAMELSYTAYNYPEGDWLFPIPGLFMGDVDKPATTFLTEHGFENVRDYNYDHDESVAHVVAHKSIEVSTLETMQENTEGELSNGLSSIDIRAVTDNYTSTVLSDNVYPIINYGSDITNNQPDQGLLSSVTLTALSSEESVSSNTRPLVVVDIRGSVTLFDWFMNFLTQGHLKFYEFEDGADDVIETLCGYEGCTECTVEDENCDCRGYLNNINNPIILVTGHSLGAAVANLVAAKLNEKVNQGDIQADVYAYTFATPTVNSSTTGNATIRYTNIFNILNTNDAVTYLPNSLLVPDTNLWSRHGIDIPINMPYDGLLSELFDTGPIGLFSHSMAVYMKWLEDNPDMTYDGLMEEVAEAKARGLLPKLLKAACPIGVTVKDSEGNIIAYESQQEGITYPEITDTGIVSWIDDDGAKVFFMPHYADAAKIEIDAYDYGTMTMTMGLLGVEETGETDESDATDETTEALNSITYNNVNLFPGRAFDVDLTEITEEVSMDDISLMEVEVNENGEREEIGEITELDSYLKSVTVDNPEVTYGTTSTFTVVTDKDAVKIRFTYRETGVTMTLTRDHEIVTNLVEDGDKLIWTVQRVFRPGAHTFDVSVKMDSTWYVTENVIALTVT